MKAGYTLPLASFIFNAHNLSQFHIMREEHPQPMTTKRSPLLAAAELQPLTRWQRWLRLQFRQPTQSDTFKAFTAFRYPERRFQPTSEGSGIFGTWTTDDADLPAYDYTLDQYADARAQYRTTDGIDHRDHWHQIGNERITGLASNDGTVQLYIADRGGMLFNKFEAWQAPHRSGGLKGWLVGLLIRLVRFIGGLGKRRDPGTVQAFSAQAAQRSASVIQNPRASLPHQQLKTLPKEEHTSSLLESYNVLAEQGEPLTVREQKASAGKQAAQEPRHAYAGGFSYIWDGQAVWSTAFRYRAAGSTFKRRFGMGYMETVTTHRQIETIRRVYAPHGNHPIVLVDVVLTNQRQEPVTLSHYEYWDVNVHHLHIEWIRSGIPGQHSDTERRERNNQFTASVQHREEEHVLEFRQDPPPDAPPEDQPAPIDWYPQPIFLADLNGAPDATYVDKDRFFGAGGALQPDAIRLQTTEDTPPTTSTQNPTPYCLIMRREVTLQPGESQTLYYMIGSARPDERRKLLEAFNTDDDWFYENKEMWRDDLAILWTEGADPLLHREMAWHTYYLLSSMVYSAFHKVKVIPQGSAYLYLHGADGAPRDQALFAVALTYHKPKLAKDLLRLVMRLTDAETGQIVYSFSGHGYLSNAMNVHDSPSDLDLFFLWAMAEYLTVTRDFDFLEEEVPFYPPWKPTKATGTTVLDHIRFALRHLLREIGLGDHGLFHVRSGDWSDSIVLETALRDGLLGVAYLNSKAHGESVPNSQMALYVLPLLAKVLKKPAPDIHDVLMDGRLDKLREAVNAQWNGKGWYNRAILRGVTNQPITIEALSLEAQVWALISGAAESGRRDIGLIERIESTLDRPSPIGGSLTPGGMVWPAISQLLTWAYARTGRGHLAWRSLHRNLFAIKADRYPGIWYGIWSAPDGLNGTDSDYPGGTWSSPLTPMQDFPVMNNNADAMALLALIRICGLEPAADGSGLIIRPIVPRDRYVVDLGLIRLEVEPKRIRGEYRAANTGHQLLQVYIGKMTVPEPIFIVFRAGQRVPFEVVEPE
jgi:hypothetical protein